MNKKWSTGLLALLLTPLSYSIEPGFTTLQFNSINFANSDEQAIAGMQWGLVINRSQMEFIMEDIFDTRSSVTISAAQGYDPFDISQEGYLSVNGIQTTDYYIPMGVTDTGGFIGSTSPIAMTVGTTILERTGTDPGTATLATQQYGIIWFSANSATPGSFYGFYTLDITKSNPDSNFNTLILPDGGTSTGLDQYINQDLKVANLQVVPEPSVYAALLGSLALLVALRRRKSGRTV